jgi:DNA-binding IclR family transcriptional regulator
MRMTPTRKLILRRLAEGPATTAKIGEILSQPGSHAREYLYDLVRNGMVKNTGPSFRAIWELAK